MRMLWHVPALCPCALGHTHQQQLYEDVETGTCIVNPGSATGAWSAFSAETGVPSFVLIKISGDSMVLYQYRLENGEVAVTKKELQTGVNTAAESED
ncbi:MAG: hypothetical protein MHM6MM_009329 [Cercozoa sp. M6MM]